MAGIGKGETKCYSIFRVCQFGWLGLAQRNGENIRVTLSLSSKHGIGWTNFKLADGVFLPGGTLNPIAGCNFGCNWVVNFQLVECYAKSLAEGRVSTAYPEGFAHAYWHPERLKHMLQRRKSACVFLGSMADMFSGLVVDEHILEVLKVVGECPHLLAIVLTKNVMRLRKFRDVIPANMIVGISVPPTYMNGQRVDQEGYMMRALGTLTVLKRLNGVRTVMSLEPLSFDVVSILAEYTGQEESCIDWLIIGAVSGAKQQPCREWVDDLHGWALLKDVPVYHKSNLKLVKR